VPPVWTYVIAFEEALTPKRPVVRTISPPSIVTCAPLARATDWSPTVPTSEPDLPRRAATDRRRARLAR
jgi:hypothetical protein